MARPKLKNAKRDKTTGRSRGINTAEVIEVAFRNRVRLVGPTAIVRDDRTGAAWANAKSGYPLGILNLWGQISDDQHDAGAAYARLVYRYCGLRGVPLPMPKSASLTLVGAGQGCKAEPDDEVVTRAKRQHADARRSLLEAGMAIGVGSRVNAITFAVCIEERPVDNLSVSDMGNLRVGLNALARVLS